MDDGAYFKTHDPRKWAAYGICDAGRSARKTADRTSIPIFTAGPNQCVFLVDWVLDRLDPGERVDALVRLVRKWRPVRFVYEELSFGNDTFFIDQRFATEGLDLRMIPVGQRGPRHNLSKHERIVQLAEWFKVGRIILPRTMLYRQNDGRVVDLIHYFLHEELLIYRGPGSTKHDDALDSFSRLLEPELRLEFLSAGDREEEPEDDERYASQKHGWEGWPYG